MKVDLTLAMRKPRGIRKEKMVQLHLTKSILRTINMTRKHEYFLAQLHGEKTHLKGHTNGNIKWFSQGIFFKFRVVQLNASMQTMKSSRQITLDQEVL